MPLLVVTPCTRPPPIDVLSFAIVPDAQHFTLSRSSCGPTCTLGTLTGPQNFRVYTLEPGIDANHPAIPPGEYPLAMAFSNKFNRNMPHIFGVDGRSGILIHAGNDSGDTEGCILVGLRQTEETVLESRDALHGLVVALAQAAMIGPTWLQVEDP